uniref:Uncharacterized protein n=1 Tax=Romanomermis culicivorax TaxID=13658 RepID=A0A915IKB2_ROMCU
MQLWVSQRWYQTFPRGGDGGSRSTVTGGELLQLGYGSTFIIPYRRHIVKERPKNMWCKPATNVCNAALHCCFTSLGAKCLCWKGPGRCCISYALAYYGG